jgi:hypothetical protein
MTYRAPINDMLLSLNHGAGLLAAVEQDIIMAMIRSSPPR